MIALGIVENAECPKCHMLSTPAQQIHYEACRDHDPATCPTCNDDQVYVGSATQRADGPVQSGIPYSSAVPIHTGNRGVSPSRAQGSDSCRFRGGLWGPAREC